MDLKRARVIALTYCGRFEPFCERIAIAGSVRRQKAQVKDIEIVLTPKITQVRDMFGEVVQEISALERVFTEISSEGAWFHKDGPRYKQIELGGVGFRGVKLDVFIVLPPAQWGVIFTIRTGPWEFSKRIVTQRSKGGLLPDGHWVQDGQVHNNQGVLPMPEEEDFFQLLELDFIPPENRR